MFDNIPITVVALISVCMLCNVSQTQMVFSLGEYLAQGREVQTESFSSSRLSPPLGCVLLY